MSDQYAPFSTRLINVGVRDSTYVLDGLPYHESDLRIEEHYTDTAGFTDHVFALMHLLGFRFAPRIRDLKDTRLYVGRDAATYPELSAMIGGSIQIDRIRDHWDEILCLATSIRTGSVTASLMVRKISCYPRQDGLAVALRELRPARHSIRPAPGNGTLSSAGGQRFPADRLPRFCRVDARGISAGVMKSPFRRVQGRHPI